MNFTTMKFGAALATAATAATLLSGAPAQALGLSDNPLTGVLSIDKAGLVQSIDSNFIDFGAANTVDAPGTTDLAAPDFTGSTGSFTGITSGTVKDLPIFSSFPLGGITDFITVQNASGLVRFDLVNLLNQQLLSNPSGPRGSFQAQLRGFFRPTNQPNDSVADIVNARLTAANNRLTIELTPVPTPALVPAAIGFGAALLRKRKSEKVAAEKA